jgi:hypothetical protein
MARRAASVPSLVVIVPMLISNADAGLGAEHECGGARGSFGIARSLLESHVRFWVPLVD